MQVLAIERDVPAADPDCLRALLPAEAKAVWDLQQQDILRCIWFTNDHRAVLQLECADEQHALSALNTLPLFREKLIDFEILALHPYDGLARLFDGQDGGERS